MSKHERQRPRLTRTTRSSWYLVRMMLAFSSASAGAWQSQPFLHFWSRYTRPTSLSCAAYTNDNSPGGGGSQQRLEETTNGAAESKKEKVDYTGAGTLGDIMSSEDKGIQIPLDIAKSPSKSGLVTEDGGTLEARFGIVSPLDRMALTANGNLQRLFSSYYDAPVHVLVDKCSLISLPGTWDRVVHLTVHNQTFCTAASVITVYDMQCRSLVQSGQVGIGQLFRHLNKLPTFTLLDAGRSSKGGLWRIYELQCDELSCQIREDFVPHAWEIMP